ncbi:MAG: hypothetical protein COU70_02195 [Parcubacteria group bacterium CG10_big_fil_rev_8_21_14_0_10_35_15]|nr:MAG: hypothetical protein COU70_02195 [Parcubacteria group bacterium CG10_big_fil_rev_8_21_14_0_10_35_15]
MLKKIYFVTGNDYKFQIAKKAFIGSDIILIQKRLDTPEIQSDDLKKIASFSIKWASNLLKKSIFLSDAGCYIEALNGFPGPFIKYINKYLTAKELLKLMAGKKNRNVIFKDCLAYCEPGKKPVLFLSSIGGKISAKPGKSGQTSINEIFIPKGFNRTESEISRDQMVLFWKNNNYNYKKLIQFLKK